MGRALGSDLRNRVLKASSEGLSARQAAIRFEVAASTAIRWIGLAAKGESAPRIRSGRPSRLDAHRAFIEMMIDGKKDITLNEMVVRLVDECGVMIGRSMVSKWLRSRGFTYKKRPHMHWSRNALAF